MPNSVKRRGSGYGVWNAQKHKWHSTKPMTHENAVKQMKIIGAADAGHPFTGKKQYSRPRLTRKST